jgi:hypothetical protein
MPFLFLQHDLAVKKSEEDQLHAHVAYCLYTIIEPSAQPCHQFADTYLPRPALGFEITAMVPGPRC